jgi:hypothetical protein
MLKNLQFQFQFGLPKKWKLSLFLVRFLKKKIQVSMKLGLKPALNPQIVSGPVPEKNNPGFHETWSETST